MFGNEHCRLKHLCSICYTLSYACEFTPALSLEADSHAQYCMSLQVEQSFSDVNVKQ